MRGSEPKVLIGVAGAGACDTATERVAEQVGRAIAARGAGLVCGGRGGVMAAACRGARESGGLTVGILPGDDAGEANPWVAIPIPTGMGEARNCILVRSARCLVAIGGEYGTLSEVAFALKLGVPVVGLRSWELTLPGGGRAPIHPADDPEAAVDLALRLAEGSLPKGSPPKGSPHE